MYTGEWERVDATATHILWTKRGMNFACLCGNYMVIGDDPHSCKLCGREYQLYVALLVRKQHYLIIGGYTHKPIGCTWGEEGKAGVLAEEPRATFEPVDEMKCPICHR